MGLLDTLDNAGSRVFGWESAAEENTREQGEEASRIAKQQQAQLAQQNSGLNVQAYDKPGITECVNWSGFDHGTIYATNQDSIKPNQVEEVGQTWKTLADGLRKRGENYHKDLSEIVKGGWQGEAADKAAEVGKPASDWMIASADAFEATGNNLKAAGTAAGEAKNRVAKPEGFSWGEAGGSFVVGGLAGAGVNALSQMEEREEAEKVARETMSRVYSPTLTQVDSQMPQYKDPQGNTKEPPPTNPGGSTPGGGMPGGGGIPGGGAGGGMPGGGIGGSGLPGGAGSGIPGGGAGGGVGGGVPGGGDYTSPSGTGSQWAGSPAGGGMPGGGVGGGAGGGVGGGAGGMAGGMVGGMPGGAAGMGAGGRAGAGGLGAGAGAGAGRGAGAGAGGRGAMGGMGAGAGAGRGRGQGGEDDEHDRPSWLEEQDDIWMNDMPKTAPPVLGE